MEADSAGDEVMILRLAGSHLVEGESQRQTMHGRYRTKRVILEIYDAMAESTRTGKPYQTRLDPPPADPRVAHPDIRGSKP
jgi:hypothetical protein